MKITSITIQNSNIHVIILQVVENQRQPALVLSVACRLLMFEPLSQGSERAGLLLLAVSCSLKPHLLSDSVILFQTKII